MRGGSPAASQLRLQNLLAHAVDRYPVEGLGHRRQRADNIEFTRSPDLVERERAVLAARPRDQAFGRGDVN